MDYNKQNYMVKLFKVLANHNRLRILDLLLREKGPQSVTLIAEKLDMDQGNLSHNLISMRKDGILNVKQEGLNMIYSVKDKNIASVLAAVK